MYGTFLVVRVLYYVYNEILIVLFKNKCFANITRLTIGSCTVTSHILKCTVLGWLRMSETGPMGVGLATSQ